MTSIYFDTVAEAQKSFKKIDLNPNHKFKTKKTSSGVEYTYYGKTTISTSLSSKVLKIAQIIACAVLIFFSAGLYQPFKDYLKHKYNTFNGTSLEIYVKENFTIISKNALRNIQRNTNSLSDEVDLLKIICDNLNATDDEFTKLCKAKFPT